MNFKMARTKAAMSQKDVAKILGLNPASVSMWETGRNAPTAKNMGRLAKLYGVTVEYLMEDFANKEQARKPQCSNEDLPTP